MVLRCPFFVSEFGDLSPYTFSYYFSSVWVVDLPPFGNELLTRLTICSLCILTSCICNLNYFRFGFEGGIWVLIAPDPGYCILFSFEIYGAEIITVTMSASISPMSS